MPFVVRYFRSGHEGTLDTDNYTGLGTYRICWRPHWYSLHYGDKRSEVLGLVSSRTCEVRTPEPVFATLQEAAAFRKVSGDLVCDLATGKVVKDTSWLFDWEKADPNCYAQRIIQRL